LISCNTFCPTDSCNAVRPRKSARIVSPGAASLRRRSSLQSRRPIPYDLQRRRRGGSISFAQRAQLSFVWWIAFESGGSLKKVPVDGGRPTSLADLQGVFAGGTWNTDDTIIFVPSFMSGLCRIPANGGPQIRVTTMDYEAGERAHLWPQMRIASALERCSASHRAPCD